MRQLALTRAAVLTPFEQIEEAIILVSGGKIVAVEPRHRIEIPPGYAEIPLEGLILAPGLIDQYVAGGGGRAETTSLAKDLAEMARFEAIHGVTAFLPAVTGDFESVLPPMALAYRQFMQSQVKGSQCLGIRLEVPRTIASFPGTRPLPEVAIAEMERLEALGGSGLKMVTLAPEVPGALECAAYFSGRGIAVSIGNSDANYDTVLQAHEKGFASVSGWLNQPHSMQPHEPGVVGAALIKAGLAVELIADGHRMHPATLELVWRAKGKEEIVLIGWDEPVVNPLEPMVTLEQTVKNFWRQTSCSLPEAFQLATYNPARLLGLAKCKGSLAPGKDADIIALTPDFDVVMTMVGGEIISGLIAV